MPLAIFAVGAFCVFQLWCCLKAKSRICKALPLLIDILLIFFFFMCMLVWNFSKPYSADGADYARREAVQRLFVFVLDGLALAFCGFVLAQPVYGAILFCRGQGGKVLGWSLAVILAIVGAVLVWWHETPDPYMASFGSVPEAVDRLEVYTFDYEPGNRRLIRAVTDPRRIERYKNAFRWEYPAAICCDEETRYIICQYAGDKMVGDSRYSYLLSRYNNYAFNFQQFLLILLP